MEPNNVDEVLSLLKKMLSKGSKSESGPTDRERAVQNIVRFFCLENCPHILHKLVSDKETRDKLAFMGDAALRFYVSKELLAQGVGTSSELHKKTQEIITNESLAKLAAHLKLSTAMASPTPAPKTAATIVEALLGTGEVHLSGKYTQEVVLKMMGRLDAL